MLRPISVHAHTNLIKSRKPSDTCFISYSWFDIENYYASMFMPLLYATIYLSSLIDAPSTYHPIFFYFTEPDLQIESCSRSEINLDGAREPLYLTLSKEFLCRLP